MKHIMKHRCVQILLLTIFVTVWIAGCAQNDNTDDRLTGSVTPTQALPEETPVPQEALDYLEAETLLDAGDYATAEAIFLALGEYEDAATRVLDCKYAAAEALLSDKPFEAARAFYAIRDHKDAFARCQAVYTARRTKFCTDFRRYCMIAEDGHLRECYYDGSPYYDALEAGDDEWCDLIEICCGLAGESGGEHIAVRAGLRADGTVSVFAEDSGFFTTEDGSSAYKLRTGRGFGERYGGTPVTEWTDIVSIAMKRDGNLLMGLKRDGTVLLCGYADEAEFEDVAGWTDVVQIYQAGASFIEAYIVGLKADGTVLVAGNEEMAQAAARLHDAYQVYVTFDSVMVQSKKGGSWYPSEEYYAIWAVMTDGTLDVVTNGPDFFSVVSTENGTPLSEVRGVEKLAFEALYSGSAYYKMGILLKEDGTVERFVYDVADPAANMNEVLPNVPQTERDGIADIWWVGYAWVQYSDGTLARVYSNKEEQQAVLSMTSGIRAADPYDTIENVLEESAAEVEQIEAPADPETVKAYENAEALYRAGKPYEAARAFFAIRDYKDAWTRCQAVYTARQPKFAADRNRYCFITEDGYLEDHTFYRGKPDAVYDSSEYVDDGAIEAEENKTALWSDLVAVCCSTNAETKSPMRQLPLRAGLRKDGTVVTNDLGSGWFTTQNGTDNYLSSYASVPLGEFRYGTLTTEWHDITAIAMYGETLLGLRSDGTVAVCGLNTDGKCEVEGWTDIVQVVVTDTYSAGLRADGSVVIAGKTDFDTTLMTEAHDIRFIMCNSDSIWAIRTDGTAFTTRGAESDARNLSSRGTAVSELSGAVKVVAPSSSELGLICLMSDGTVEQYYTVGRSPTEVPLVAEQVEGADIADIGFGDENGCFVWAQCADGSIIAAKNNYWMNFGYYDITTVKKAALPLS